MPNIIEEKIIKYPKARLLVSYRCPKNCSGCCNKNKNFNGAPPEIIKNYKYKEIYITGGEPMLFPKKLIVLIKEIMKSKAKIFLYTATYDEATLLRILPFLDGITITLHDKDDYKMFNAVRHVFDLYPDKSYRLNIFYDAVNTRLNIGHLPNFNISFKKWIKNAPIPDGEEFVRLKELW